MTIDVVELARDRLDETEPLWRALYDHHAAVAPQLADRRRPFELSWGERRELEREWLRSDPRSFALAGVDDARIVAYALVEVRTGSFAASWTISDPHADLKTLAVLPEYQGRGLGSQLMDAVEARLAERGIDDLSIDVMSGNSGAVRFYARRGAVQFTATYLQPVVGRTRDR